VLSIQCGLPREVAWHGQTVTTSIFKQPVHGRIALRTLNLDGDRQSDLTVHGGRHKAVYCYPTEHYAYWAAEMPGRTLENGAFGENFTTEGLLEDSVHIGDRFAVGSAEVIVSQPRMPCYKLGIKFESGDMVRRFLASGRSGFYLAVAREGEVAASDDFRLVDREPQAVSVSEITHLYLAEEYDADDIDRVRRALTLNALPASWKVYLEEKVSRQEA